MAHRQCLTFVTRTQLNNERFTKLQRLPQRGSVGFERLCEQSLAVILWSRPCPPRVIRYLGISAWACCHILIENQNSQLPRNRPTMKAANHEAGIRAYKGVCAYEYHGGEPREHTIHDSVHGGKEIWFLNAAPMLSVGTTLHSVQRTGALEPAHLGLTLAIIHRIIWAKQEVAFTKGFTKGNSFDGLLPASSLEIKTVNS